MRDGRGGANCVHCWSCSDVKLLICDLRSIGARNDGRDRRRGKETPEDSTVSRASIDVNTKVLE